MMRSSINTIAFCLLCSLTFAQRVLQLDERDDYSLSGYVQYYMDTTWLAPQQVFEKIKQGHGTTLQKNYFGEAPLNNLCWLYFRIRNDAKDKTVIFRTKRSDIHHFESFKKATNSIDTLVVTGDAYPFKQRHILVNDFCFPIALKANEEAEIVILLEKRWEELNCTFTLQQERTFYYNIRQDYLFLFFYTGATCFILIFNIFLWLNLKDKIHFYYVLNLICNLTLALSVFGLGFEYLWPNFTYQTSIINSILAVLLTLSNLTFMSQFLGLKDNSQFYKPIQLFSWFLLGWAILTLPALFIKITYYPPWSILSYRYAMLIFIGIAIVMLALTITEQINRKNPYAKIYTLSIAFISIGAIMYSAAVLSQVVWLRASDFIIWGNLLEILTLTFGLTIRYNAYKKHNTDLALQLVETQNEISKQILQTQIEIQNQTLQHVGKELHDNIGQLLSVAKWQLDSLVDNQTHRKTINGTVEIVEQAIRELRALSKGLDGDFVKDFGLVQSLQHELTRIEQTGKCQTHLHVMGIPVNNKPQKEMVLFRIAQEIINNVLKHAHAQNITVFLQYNPQTLLFSISDDGKGFDMVTTKKHNIDNSGAGLRNMQRRAELLGGNCNINSEIGKGTIITITIPLS